METALIDPNISNIEVGAGRGTFGKEYYSTCYLTDSNWDLIHIHCITTLDCICDAHAVPSPDGKYNIIIMCNPFGYGFDEEEAAFKLLSECARLLNKGGRIIIVGKDSNKYCAPPRVQTRVTRFLAVTGIEFTFSKIDISQTNPFPGYRFEQCDFRQTFPNFLIELSLN